MRVSIAVCTYNGGTYVYEQLKSILTQTRIPDELVICDDCSKDNTVAVIRQTLKKLAPPEIEYRIIINEKNLGYPKNFEKCSSLCSGDIIFFADQDDVWLPNKIERMILEFEKNPDCVLCYCDAIVTDSALNKRLDSLYTANNHYSDILIRKAIDEHCAYGCTMAVRKRMMEQISPFCLTHDHYISLCAPLFGDVVALRIPLMMYRRNNRAVTGNMSKNSIIRKAQRIAQFIQAIQTMDREKWFRNTLVLSKNYGEYFDRFGDKLFQTDPDTYVLLEQRIRFAKELGTIIKQNRIRAVNMLIRTYTEGSYFLRGNRNTLLLDILFLLYRGKQ